jgi:hypothetical protein
MASRAPIVPYKPLIAASSMAKALTRPELSRIATYILTDGANITVEVDDLEDYPRREAAVRDLLLRGDEVGASLVEMLLVTLDSAFETIWKLRANHSNTLAALHALQKRQREAAVPVKEGQDA